MSQYLVRHSGQILGAMAGTATVVVGAVVGVIYGKGRCLQRQAQQQEEERQQQELMALKSSLDEVNKTLEEMLLKEAQEAQEEEDNDIQRAIENSLK